MAECSPRCAMSSCRWTTTRPCVPATARHHDRARAGDQPLPAGPVRCALRFPGAAAGAALRRAGRARPAARRVRAARLRTDRDARRRVARPAGAQGRDRQGGLRPAPAARRATTTATPGSACTSTSPSRSRATCSSTPGTWSSRSAATRSRRCGAASGRRPAATASSPRPTSTSSPATRCPSTTTSRSRGSWPRRWRRWTSCRRCACRSTTAGSSRVSTAGSGADDPAAVMRVIDKVDKVPADGCRRLFGSEAGLTEAAGRDVPRARRDPRHRHVVRRARSGAGRRSPTLLDQGLDELAEVVAGCAPLQPGVAVEADLRIARGLDYYTGTVFETRMAGYESLGLDLLGRPLRLAGLGRQGHLSRRRHLAGRDAVAGAAVPGRRRRPASRAVPSAVLVALPDEDARAACDAHRAGAARPRHRHRGRRRAAEVRQADPLRRAPRHPVRLVPRRAARRRPPGQGHPHRRPGRRRPVDLDAARKGPATAGRRHGRVEHAQDT